jgi:hypothetical protein
MPSTQHISVFQWPSTLLANEVSSVDGTLASGILCWEKPSEREHFVVTLWYNQVCISAVPS